MRQVVVARPFAGGYRSDVPDYALNPNESAYAQDLIFPNGIAQQRWGWAYEGSAIGSNNLVGAYRAYFPITGATRTLASNDKGYIYADGTSRWSDAFGELTEYIPRCVYGGDVIFCAQDGVTPLIRYGGSTLTYANSTPFGGTGGTWNVPAGSSTLTEVTGTAPSSVPFPLSTSVGAFAITGFYGTTNLLRAPIMSSHILSAKTASITGGTAVTQVTLEGIRNTQSAAMATAPANEVFISPTGFAYPAIEVYSVGTVSSVGTSPSTGGNVWTLSGASLGDASAIVNAMNGDALLMLNPTPGGAHEISSIYDANATSSTISTYASSSTYYANTQYKILRRLPFKDATVHKNSLWGTGVKQYPNRVYVAPPLWNMGHPPGSIDPYDPSTGFTDVSDFLMTPVDVPSQYDSDPVVALLSTNGPLLVLKGNSVYGIYGTYPSYEQTLIANGSGCIDLRSAISVDGIAYWAGKDGVFMYAGGQVVSLTAGKIEEEWQALMRQTAMNANLAPIRLGGGGSSPSIGAAGVTCGVVSGHLIVSVYGLTNTSGLTGAIVGPDTSAPTNRTLVYDLRSRQWASRMSNAVMRQMHSVRVGGETPALFGVSNTYPGRIIDLAPAVTGAQCTNRDTQAMTDADATDDAGTGPRMQAWSASSLAGASGIEGEARMLDMSLHTNIYDTASTPTTTLGISTVHGEALDEKTTSVVTRTPITADTANRVDRSKRRINRTGRLHQVRLDLSTTNATNKKTEIPEMVASFRDNRRMT